MFVNFILSTCLLQNKKNHDDVFFLFIFCLVYSLITIGVASVAGDLTENSYDLSKYPTCYTSSQVPMNDWDKLQKSGL